MAQTRILYSPEKVNMKYKEYYKNDYAKNNSMRYQHADSPQLSPLQKLQIQYQQKLLAEKQEKMSLLYNNARERSQENIYHNSSSEVKKYFKSAHTDSGSRQFSRKPNAYPPDTLKPRRPNTLPPIGRQTNLNANTRNYEQEISPNLNPKHLTNLHRRKLKHQQRTNHTEWQVHGNEEKLTDFQKFQIEQDNQRKARLDNHLQNQRTIKFSMSAQPPGNANYIETPNRYSENIGTDRSTMFKQHHYSTLTTKNNKENVQQKEKHDEIKRLMAKLDQKKKELLLIQKENEQYESYSENEDNSVNYKVVPNDNAFTQKPVLIRRDRSNDTSRASSHSATTSKHSIRSGRKNKTVESNQKISEPYSPILVQSKKTKPKPIKHKTPIPDDVFETPIINKNQPMQQRNLIVGDELIQEQPDSEIKLINCHMCGRNFNQNRIDKHYNVCRRTHNKQRKQFDTTKARTVGTDMEKYNRKSNRRKKENPLQVKKSDWRSKHEEFIRNIRDAKLYQQHIAKGGKASDLPPPVPSKNDDYVLCQHCNRRFNPTVAERHIPKCQDIKAKPTFLKKRSRR